MEMTLLVWIAALVLSSIPLHGGAAIKLPRNPFRRPDDKPSFIERSLSFDNARKLLESLTEDSAMPVDISVDGIAGGPVVAKLEDSIDKIDSKLKMLQGDDAKLNQWFEELSTKLYFLKASNFLVVGSCESEEDKVKVTYHFKIPAVLVDMKGKSKERSYIRISPYDDEHHERFRKLCNPYFDESSNYESQRK